MRNSKNKPGEDSSEPRPHDWFVELCALSTSGELTDEEQNALAAHLVECPDCRHALKEFEAAVDIGVPLLHSRLSSLENSEWETTSDEGIRVASARSTLPAPKNGIGKNGAISSPMRNGHHQMQVDWNYAWLSFAAAIVLVLALGIYTFQFGKQKGQESLRQAFKPVDTSVEVLEQKLSDAGHERQVLLNELEGREHLLSELRSRVEKQNATLNEIRKAQADLERSRQSDEIEKQQLAEERTGLSQRLYATQASLEKLQVELNSERQKSEQNRLAAEGLEGQIRVLNVQLREREEAIGRQEEWLAHDRDIRELIGARDLYIAEVYDVERDGTTQKPYGRVFFTKGKSLIFYAYDLDQPKALKNVNVFQAWGRSGPDRQQALNLGIFYEDNVGKKRWVLKFDDSKTLAQIDAIFVTVEPTGGSRHPSGKPFLFASLRISSNHP